MKNGSILAFGPVSSAVPEPLYGQIIANVKREVWAGRLKPDEALPSTRGLAADLGVSVITVTRAYEELEREGLVYSRQGQGTFVARLAPEKLQMEHSAPRVALRVAIDAARKANIRDEDLIALLKSELLKKGQK